jgi:hypothetical protein
MRKMMKTMATALLMFVAVGASAQSVTYPRFHMGIRGGLTVNSISIADFEGNDKALTFAHGGLAFDFRLAPFPLYFETGAYYMNKGFSTESTYNYGWGYGRTETYKEDDHYVYAPALFSYHIYLNDKMALQPFVGATFGYLTESSDFESAIRVGLGFNLGRLYANVGYDFGVVKHDIGGYTGRYLSLSTYRNNTFFATIGFNFAGSR